MIEWSEVVSEFVGFIASFLAIGAIGFRHVVMPSWRVADASGREAVVRRDALQRAALLGLAGAIITSMMFFSLSLPATAARQHESVGALLHAPQPAVQAVFVLLAVIGFAIALLQRPIGWTVAFIGVVGNALMFLWFGQWSRWANPVHRFAAALWIGTLFVLVAAGLASILKDVGAPIERGRIAANLVNAFSPLALVSFAVLAIAGLTTAWKHLKTLSALWTTPYGYALCVKLLFVLGVIALGAWNWRKQKPLMGSEEAATALRRSATAELAVATVVLVITAVLVSLPSPR